MRTKDETAQLLADAHFRLDEGVARIFRVLEPAEADPRRPIKLLEISPMTTEVGISPVGMTADPARGELYASVIIEITPAEFDRLQRGELSLPNGWQVGAELFSSGSAATRAAS